MELKSYNGIVANPNGESSNRTFMELKYDKPVALPDDFSSSNRTFMELKCYSTLNSCTHTIVLIVPLWN